MLLCMYYSHTPSDKSGDLAGRYRSDRPGNLHATGWLLIGRGSCRQRGTRIAPLAKFENLSPPETTCSHHQMRKSSTVLNLQHPGGGNGDPPGRFRLARCGNANTTGWLLCHGACARRKSCLSGQRRRSAAPGEDAVSLPHWEVIDISATSTTRQQRRRLLGTIRPRHVCKLQPHWLVAVSSRDPAQ